ncbi:MAG: isocitrate lyase [Alphaproteobacteria bacterium]
MPLVCHAPRPHPSTWPAPHWAPDRWTGIRRDYEREVVSRLSGSLRLRHTLAERGAEKLWRLLKSEAFVPSLGAYTGNQAVQHVRAGLKAIYLSGWQVAADGNTAGQMYPDQSLYPVDSGPVAVKRINQALMRADQIQSMERDCEKETTSLDFFVPIVADAEAGFGGPLNAFELTKAFIEAGTAAVHLEDQLAAEKKCGHLGGKVLVPTGAFIRTLNAARLAADVLGVPTLIMARTDANSARLLTSDSDERDQPFVTGERSPEGFHRIRGGLDCAIARGLAYAPYADLLWCETPSADLDEARRFAEAIKAEHPEQMLAYNCSPSFNWSRAMGPAELTRFQRELGAMGYKFQFVTLAGYHSLNHATFQLARDYLESGMAAYARLQDAEFALSDEGYTAVRHQREVGTGYFDAVANAVAGGAASTAAMPESTEGEQF